MDEHEDYDSDNSDESRLLPPHPEDWQDYYSELLVEVYHVLKDEAHLTGILDKCQLNDLAEACYAWSTGIGVPILNSNEPTTNDPTAQEFASGLWKTIDGFRNAEPEFLRFLDQASFLLFCDRVSASPLLAA